MKPEILVVIQPQEGLPPLCGFDVLREDFEVHYAPDALEADKLIAKVGSKIRACVWSDGIGMTGEQIRALPKLELIHTRGAGYERFDLDAVREKGIIFATGHHVNYFSVAEHAMAILLMVVRDLRTADAEAHKGLYRECKARAPRPLIYGKCMGILGLGDIGLEIAKRAIGFDVTIKYHNKNRRTDVPYEYVGNLVELAAQSDILMIIVPGGSATKGIVNREVLDALGPAGFLVNIGRGTVVDTRALVDALHEKRIAGAALDVVEGEPDHVPQYVLQAPNLILTPHLGASSLQSRLTAAQNVAKSLKAHFSGQPVPNRVV
jgi:lactate dehydrogenase-like 2-hydroxyacid dehydrogenase